MAKLKVQRFDRADYFGDYVFYVNRKECARIPFGQSFEIDLEPGYYQINIGGKWGLEAEAWFTMGEHRKGFVVEAHWLKSQDRKWPKWYQLSLQEKPFIQLPLRGEVQQLKRNYQQGLIRSLLFSLLVFAFLIWLYVLAQDEQNEILRLAAILGLPFIWFVNKGMRMAMLKNTAERPQGSI
jgi:hypothetical protein